MNEFKKNIREFLKRCIPISKKTILFESVPDLSDNTYYVFEEMIKRGLNKKYSMVWIVKNKNSEELPKIHNVKYVDFNYVRFHVPKTVIECNLFIAKKNKKQRAFYLGHGVPLKAVHGYYTAPKEIDYFLSPACEMTKPLAYELDVPEEKFFVLGFPRNDVFHHEKIDLQKFFDYHYKKIVVWFPTYRQHENKRVKVNTSSLPIIHNVDLARELNDFARSKGILIVLKPHFAQDVSLITDLKLSNIIFINDRFFVDNNIKSYDFVNSCDALITDYSSIYYDYTLADKPIAAVWEDIEEYRKFPGFAVDVDDYMKGAEKVYDIEDFKIFLSHIANGEDVLKNERREIRDRVHFAADGKNAERVVDFIIEKAGL